MKSKDLQPRLLYPEKISFRIEGQTKCFPDKVKLKEFIITKPLLQEMLRVLLYEKEELSTLKSQHIHNYQQWNLKKQTNKKQPKQTTRTETGS